jgi:hypothetical protein
VSQNDVAGAVIEIALEQFSQQCHTAMPIGLQVSSGRNADVEDQEIVVLRTKEPLRRIRVARVVDVVDGAAIGFQDRGSYVSKFVGITSTIRILIILIVTHSCSKSCRSC